MAYRYKSRRSARRLARRSRRNFLITLLIIGILIYATIQWVLPSFISGIGFIKNILKPPQDQPNFSENTTLAPPVLNIPYEATNTAQINISGFGTLNSKVKLYLDDEPKTTAQVRSDGSFTLEDVPLVLGTNNIYGKTLDEGGESLPSKTIRVLYDNEKPPLAIFEPEDGKKIQGERKLKISGKTEPGARVFINGSQTIVDRDGNFFTEQLLNDGDNNFNIRAEDLATNTTEVERHVFFTP